MDTLIDLIGELLPFAMGVAVSPLPIIAVVLVLMGESSRAGGVAFLLGRVVGLAIVVGVVALVVALIPEAGESILSSGARLIIGLALIVLGVTKWRPKPDGVEQKLPAWMSAFETMPPAKTFRTAILLSVINVKELLIMIGVGTTLGDADLSVRSELIAIAAFIAIGSVLVAAPVIATLVAPERMAGGLGQIRAWLVQHQSAVMGVVLLVIGALLAGAAIQDLA